MICEHRADEHRSVLSSGRFLSTALVGVLATVLVVMHGSLPAQLAVAGVCLSIIAACLVTMAGQHGVGEHKILASISRLHSPLTLAHDSELFEHYTALSRGLVSLSERSDPLLREFAVMKLASISEQVASLAAGEIVFTSTESWRTAYERLLQIHGLGEYLSVAWVKSADYWHDTPGRQSLRLNYEVAARGLRIESFIILRDSLWPPGERWPCREVFRWIEEQHQHGLLISLARESALLTESDLLCDFGIYGARAVGIHELDEQSRTLRFVLHFGRQQHTLAHDRWARLALYGISFSELLDRTS